MSMSKSMTDAVKWLRDHGGDGVFADKSHQTLYAMGEKAPFMRLTWNQLAANRAVEFYGNRPCPAVGGFQ